MKTVSETNQLEAEEWNGWTPTLAQNISEQLNKSHPLELPCHTTTPFHQCRKTAPHLSKAINSWADLQSFIPHFSLESLQQPHPSGEPPRDRASLSSWHNSADTILNKGNPQPKGNSSPYFLLISPGVTGFLSGDLWALLEYLALWNLYRVLPTITLVS